MKGKGMKKVSELKWLPVASAKQNFDGSTSVGKAVQLYPY